MIEQFKHYEKWKELYRFNSIEAKIAIFSTSIFFILFLFGINLYENFLYMQKSISDFLLCIIGAEVGLLGIALAGMAIVTGMLDAETLAIINKVDEKDTVNRVLTSFAFLALNYIIQILYLVILYFCIISPAVLISKVPFLIIAIIIVYHFSFNIAYTLGLIGNCISLNEVKSNCNKITKLNKNIFEAANEVRIEYLIANLAHDKEINSEVILSDLIKIMERYEYPDKEELLKYLKRMYQRK